MNTAQAALSLPAHVQRSSQWDLRGTRSSAARINIHLVSRLYSDMNYPYYIYTWN